MKISSKFGPAYGNSLDMIETTDINLFGKESKNVEARLKLDEKSITLHNWDDSHSGMFIPFAPNFPVYEIENKYYSVDDYLTTIGGQFTNIMGFVVFFASKFLY